MSNTLTMILNGKEREVAVSEADGNQRFTAKATYAGKSCRMEDDVVDLVLGEAELIPAGLEKDVHMSNSDNGYDYAFHDYRLMSRDVIRASESTGRPLIYVSFDQAERGEEAGVTLELFQEVMHGHEMHDLAKYVERLLDAAVRCAEDPASYWDSGD